MLCILSGYTVYVSRVPTKQTQQVRCSIHLRHRHIRVFSQDLGVLRPLKLVKQLSAQHDVEVLPDPCHHFTHSVFPKQTEKRKVTYLERLLETAEVTSL